MKSKIALIALAMASLLIVPAFSMPSDKGAFMAGHDAGLCSMNNLTQEEMGNLTLGEMRELRQQAWNNSTKGGAMHGQNRNKGGALAGMAHGTPMLLLIGDLTVEKLNNMTINQIRELQQKKVQELDNMTLNQIKDLQEKRIQVQNNMTLKELRNMQQIAAIMDLGRMERCRTHAGALGPLA